MPREIGASLPGLDLSVPARQWSHRQLRCRYVGASDHGLPTRHRWLHGSANADDRSRSRHPGLARGVIDGAVAPSHDTVPPLRARTTHDGSGPSVLAPDPQTRGIPGGEVVTVSPFSAHHHASVIEVLLAGRLGLPADLVDRLAE